MTIAYWCVFASILMPTAFTLIAKMTSKDYGFKANHHPREFLESLSGFRKRAHWVQLNTFESIPAFMGAVIIAHQQSGDQDLIDKLAIAYIVLRIVYGVLYMADKAELRTLVWLAALLTILGQFFTF